MIGMLEGSVASLDNGHFLLVPFFVYNLVLELCPDELHGFSVLLTSQATLIHFHSLFDVVSFFDGVLSAISAKIVLLVHGSFSTVGPLGSA